MPYVTSVERIAEERGRIQGRDEGRAEGRAEGRVRLLRQLTRVCGELPESIQQRLRNLSPAQLDQLDEDLLDFAALADLVGWLESHPPMPADK